MLLFPSPRCVYGLIFHNRTDESFFSSSSFPLIGGTGESSEISTKSISLGCLFHDPSKNEPHFLARVFDLISDDPRSSNSRVQTKKTLHAGAVYLAERLHFRGLFIRAPRNEKYRKERKGGKRRRRRRKKSANDGEEESKKDEWLHGRRGKQILLPGIRNRSGSIYEPFNREIVI